MSAWFLRPEAWPVLLLAPLAALALWALDRARRRRLVRAVGPRLRALARGAGPARRRTARALFVAGLLLAGIAWMRPAWGEATRAVERRGVDVVACLDVSRSMRARDLEPDRLERARADLRALAERAAGDRLGLVVFAGDARLAVPLTRDRASFATIADDVGPLSVERGGTDLGAALALAAGALDPGGDRPAAVLLLTDGEDHGAAGLRAAEALRARGVEVHAVGYGSRLGAKIPVEGEGGEAWLRDREGREVVSALDPATLRAIARATGGAYVDAATTPDALVALYRERIGPRAGEAFAREARRLREPRFQWPLAAAWVCWLLALALGEGLR